MMTETTGFAPHPLFFERMQRLQTAMACGTPDRVPISLVMDLFAANTMGVSYTDYRLQRGCGRRDHAGRPREAGRRGLPAVPHLCPGRAGHALAGTHEATRPRPARAQSVADGRAGAHPAGGLRQDPRDRLESLVRPVHREVSRGGRRGRHRRCRRPVRAGPWST